MHELLMQLAVTVVEVQRAKSMNWPTVAFHSPHQGAKNCTKQTQVKAADAVGVSCDQKVVETTPEPLRRHSSPHAPYLDKPDIAVVNGGFKVGT
jgi:hypothetical protein